MRSFRSEHDLVAVSANLKETALNTEQTLDTSLLVDRNTILQLAPRREDNREELTGKEEPDASYDLGALSEATFEFSKAQAQHFGFGYAFALGTSAASAWGTGYKHLITPTADMLNPSFTAAMRLGQTIMKRRFASFLIDQLTATFAKDSWAKLSLSVKGTGKYTDNVTKETVSAAFNATELTLAANGVQGSTASGRVDSIHAVRVLVPTTGEYKDVTVTAVSSATPAVLTITAPGEAATSTTYEILYVPTEPAWCTFPSRVTESPLRVTDLVVKVGGLWNGTTFLEGHTMSEEIESIEHVISNEMAVEFRPGGTGTYANYAYRQRRIQTLKLDRQFRDFIMQRKIIDNEYFGVQMKATGAEFESGKNYCIDVVFPRCVVLKAPLKINGNFLGEEGDLQVLEDDTYGSVRVEVANKVSQYAA
ncbi:MAG: hypothetical protein KA801_10425 [Syntrophorhabdaceae bacterium]|nr:hypothetical protein [Syntrophorhabdaceae bacterium]